LVLGAGLQPVLAAAKPFTAALVIGNAHYESLVALKNPANDADDLCAALSAIGFQTTCLVDVDTRVHLRAVIEDFVESLPPGAVSIIYYAGHGLQVNGENYLIPTHAQLTDEQSVPQNALSLSFLMRQLSGHPGLLKLVILDACRDNPLVSSGRRLAPGLGQIMDIPDATEVVYAAAANEPAVDGAGRNGTFTKQLLQHLRDPGTLDDLFKEVSQAVQADTRALGYTQKPARYTNFSGQYCLVSCAAVETLQAQQREAERTITELKARVSAGDERARDELAAAQASNEKLKQELQRRDEEQRAAAKEARQRQRGPFVPPAL
jgi:uncharacterized caspase-like protein